ncbi:hypothetical protein J4558_00090 [Leptolyngbya sp. 15MV]|nr:hypothetical protein J4558_00090 [Leptolyngbya sp. 15MV]
MLIGLWGRIAGAAAAVVAAVVGFLMVMARARESGRREVRDEAVRQDQANQATRAAVEADVARGADPRERLRARWTRPDQPVRGVAADLPGRDGRDQHGDGGGHPRP